MQPYNNHADNVHKSLFYYKPLISIKLVHSSFFYSNQMLQEVCEPFPEILH